MNITTVPIKELSSQNVIIFMFGCIIVLLAFVIILFGSVTEGSVCYIVGKFIKIKLIKFCCCCRKGKQLLENNALELKEIITSEE